LILFPWALVPGPLPTTPVMILPNETNTKETVASLMLKVFDSYLSEFLVLTRRAKERFEQRDWKGGKRDALERLSLYEKVLSQITTQVEGLLGRAAFERATWIGLKRIYSRLIAGRCNQDIAETFFNSITRKLLQTVGIDRDVEFFYLHPRPQTSEQASPVFTRYDQERDTKELLRKILADHKFSKGYENLERDLELIANELNLFLWPIVRNDKSYVLEVLKPCFFRNKVAYIVGRIVVESRIIPIILPLYHDEAGIYIDSILLQEADANNIFGFAYSYFQVDAEVPHDLVVFLSSLLPHKPLPDLYNAIGFYKHGKTEFYRDLHRFIHVSREQFVVAPGEEGAVMIVFTLPHYHYVFKVIKDRPCFVRSGNITDKTIDESQVKARYKFVCNRDRVGRLVDTQEFENVKFKVKRYSEKLLSEFEMAAKNTATIKDGYVIVDHLYLQRKVTPLPMYLVREEDPHLIRQVIIDFGYFIKDLAATGLFPADLFNTWNYGVTEGNRVVSYDYDDIIPLEDARFKTKPKPRDEYEELGVEEDWISAVPNDFFMDEIDTYLGIPDPLRGIFYSVHKDLFTTEFWQSVKLRVQRGEIIDIIPYDREKRFRTLSREA
jgi:isocitrate dehydrogenase kinase/phosphatase